MRTTLFLVLLAGCYDTSSAPTCRIQCTTDADCTDGLTCGPGNLCTDGADCLQPEMCTPDEFIACVDTMARSCNAAGDGTTDVTCTSGCNTTERRCNDCVPDATSCTTDMMAVQQCTPDGRTNSVTDTCAAGCNPGDTAIAAHCSYISPAWLPDICDAPATDMVFAPNASATISTSLDTNCSSIVVQMANGNPIGPQICVIRAKTITIPNAITTTFSGNRAIALVADSQLTVTGTIDVGAINAANTPGPGIAGGSGTASTSSAGGGGAGFGTAGGNGGATTAGAGGAGGQVIDPLTRAFFAGGYSGASPGGIGNPASDIAGGAGGGGLLLIACRGNVSITGQIDANGGGGRGNHDIIGGAGFQNSKAPSGAGSGGYVVVQGLTVTISGGVFANGGGGGGGSNTDDGSGPIGNKGLRTTGATTGGVGNLSTGGNGGVLAGPGQNGTGATAGGGFGGGGGGGVGVIHAYTPTGVIPVTTGATFSPNYTRRNVVLR